MKKFLALLFVCAGLTAMAAPHVTKTDLTQAPKGQMVMKSNTLANQFTAGVSKNFMEAAKKDVQRHSMEATRAPKRLTAEEMINNPYVCFLYAATYDDDGNYVAADPFYAGSGAYWYPDLSDGLAFAGFYWDDEGSTYYLPLDVDFNTGEVALDWGFLLKDDTTSNNPGARNRVDTIRYQLLVSEDYFLNENQNPCLGTLYNDGSIIFDDNYVYYRYEAIVTYRYNQETGRTENEATTVYIGTEILAANGNLTYNKEQDGSAANSYVYMYQNEAADTLFVGNMWNYGMPNVALTISPEAKMNYNCTIEEDGTTYLYNPLWDVDDTWISGGLGDFYGLSELIPGDDGYDVVWGFEGDVTPQQITWPYASMCNGYHILYGWENNVLTWLNGNTFRVPTAGPEYTRGDVDKDGEVAIADVTALIDALLSGNLDDSDNFDSLAADCDEDGEIAIADVAALIDFLLTDAWPVEE